MSIHRVSTLLALVIVWAAVAAIPASGAEFVTGPSNYTHTVDGYFTDWPAVSPAVTYEWYDITPVKGVYSFLYLDYTADKTLYLMNDWVAMTETPGPGLFNLFILAFDTGTYTVKIWVDTGTAEITGPGGTVVGASGAYGFGASPNLAAAHTMYEFLIPSFPVLPPGAVYTGTECDPIAMNNCPWDIAWKARPVDGGGIGVEPSPEPSSLLLLGFGTLALCALSKRRRWWL